VAQERNWAVDHHSRGAGVVRVLRTTDHNHRIGVAYTLPTLKQHQIAQDLRGHETEQPTCPQQGQVAPIS